MKHIFWVDLEMTGLDPEVHRIIEFAGIITDLNLESLATFHQIVFQPPQEIAKMDAWNIRTHGDSGLLKAIPEGEPLEQTETRVLSFLEPFFENEQAVLAGNSIHQDRKFIDRYMPRLAEKLHYRMLDVSSFKQVFKFIYKTMFQKDNTHRALDDIQASIDELKFYQSFISLPIAEAVDEAQDSN